MFKNKLLVLLCMLAVFVVFIGCGGGSSDYGTGNQIAETKPASYKIEKGRLIPTNGGIQGVEIDINNNTFEDENLNKRISNLFTELYIKEKLNAMHEKNFKCLIKIPLKALEAAI